MRADFAGSDCCSSEDDDGAAKEKTEEEEEVGGNGEAAAGSSPSSSSSKRVIVMPSSASPRLQTKKLFEVIESKPKTKPRPPDRGARGSKSNQGESPQRMLKYSFRYVNELYLLRVILDVYDL